MQYNGGAFIFLGLHPVLCNLYDCDVQPDHKDKIQVAYIYNQTNEAS